MCNICSSISIHPSSPVIARPSHVEQPWRRSLQGLAGHGGIARAGLPRSICMKMERHHTQTYLRCRRSHPRRRSVSLHAQCRTTHPSHWYGSATAALTAQQRRYLYSSLSLFIILFFLLFSLLLIRGCQPDHQPKAVSPASPTEPSRDHRLRRPRHYIHHICFGRPLGYILRQLWFAPGASLSPFLLAHRDRPRLRCSYHDIHRVGSLCRARLRCALPVLPLQSRLQQDGAPSALTHSPLCGPVLQLYLKSVYVRNI